MSAPTIAPLPSSAPKATPVLRVLVSSSPGKTFTLLAPLQ